MLLALFLQTTHLKISPHCGEAINLFVWWPCCCRAYLMPLMHPAPQNLSLEPNTTFLIPTAPGPYSLFAFPSLSLLFACPSSSPRLVWVFEWIYQLPAVHPCPILVYLRPKKFDPPMRVCVHLYRMSVYFRSVTCMARSGPVTMWQPRG